MSLSIILQDIIQQHILAFIDKLAENEHQKEQMIAIWNDKPPKMKLLCTHILTSGKNIGKKCDKKISSKSTTYKYCTSHIKYEHIKSSITKEKKVVEIMERASIILFKTIGDRLVDPNTQLVFDKKKLVIGKQRKGIMVPLGPDDLDFCLKQKLICADELTK